MPGTVSTVSTGKPLKRLGLILVRTITSLKRGVNKSRDHSQIRVMGNAATRN
jgi:hypothetical protein